MKVDFHVHIFPTWTEEEREELCRRERAFREMYGSSKASIIGHDLLLRSMDEAEIDVSVVLGFAWDDPKLCRRHNDYLLEAAARSGGRLLPFCTVNMGCPGAVEEVDRCAQAGAVGLGELRPQDQGWDLQGPAGEALAYLARKWGLALLFHVTEPVGHLYPGKGGLALNSFYNFAASHPDLIIIGAHLGGGLPFYAYMPEVQEVCQRIYFDTAACPYLYRPEVYLEVVRKIGAERLLFGSDFPLLGQKRALAHIQGSGLGGSALDLILGQNAQAMLMKR